MIESSLNETMEKGLWNFLLVLKLEMEGDGICNYPTLSITSMYFNTIAYHVIYDMY